MTQAAKLIYVLIIALIVFPFDHWGLPTITAPVALLAGLIFAFIFKNPYPKFNKKTSKYLLQASVVCLGFKMNIEESLKSGSEGMMFTVVSVIGVMALGVMVGYWLSLNRKTSYLIASGTAICGGSAIAAVGPVLKANENEMAVSLGVIFILNAIALFIFPPIGHLLDMTQQQFGTWAAIAIHDTSSVVGAGLAYGRGSRHRNAHQAHPRSMDYTLSSRHNVYLQRERQQDFDTLVYLPLYPRHGHQHLYRTA